MMYMTNFNILPDKEKKRILDEIIEQHGNGLKFQRMFVKIEDISEEEKRFYEKIARH